MSDEQYIRAKIVEREKEFNTMVRGLRHTSSRWQSVKDRDYRQGWNDAIDFAKNQLFGELDKAALRQPTGEDGR